MKRDNGELFLMLGWMFFGAVVFGCLLVLASAVQP